VQVEFLLLEGTLERRVERGAGPRVFVHAGAVVAVLVLPRRLGRIHRGVGVADECRGVVAVAREHADADARRERGRAPLHDQRFGGGAEQLGGEGRGEAAVVEVLHHDDELVAADAGHGVHVAGAAGKAARDLLEDAIAGLVAAGVVDVLEAVEVHEEHGEGTTLPAGHRDRVVDGLLEGVAVREAGERVGHGLRAQRGGVTRALEGAEHDAHDAGAAGGPAPQAVFGAGPHGGHGGLVVFGFGQQHHRQGRLREFQLREGHAADVEIVGLQQHERGRMRPQVIEGAAEPGHTLDADGAAAGGVDLVGERPRMQVAADDHMQEAERVARRADARPQARQVEELVGGRHGGPQRRSDRTRASAAAMSTPACTGST
jgi:hypothetical protein